MTFIETFRFQILQLGNHHYYNICKETFEDRGNKLLAESHEFLRNNKNINSEEKIQIKCWQFWLVGFLSGQNHFIKDENLVSIYI